MGNHGVLKVAIFLLVIAVCWLGFCAPVTAADYDYELQDVMNGNVPGLATFVQGNGPYYGDSIRATFSNNTGQAVYIRVPIGLQLVPANSGVQTMLTAGGETLAVPPGQSSYPIKAFCGEKHDSAPGTSDTFSAGGLVSGDTLQTLQEINRQEAFNQTGQHAVWHQTDGYDITGEEGAVNLVSGGGVSPGTAAAAGGATAGVAVLATVLTNLLNGGTAAGVDTGDDVPPGDDYPPDDEFTGEDDEPVELPDDDYEEYPPPDDELYERPPVESDEPLPDNLKPPIEIAEIPPPEDPGDGVQIAGDGDLEWLWNIYLQGRDMEVQVPDKLPPHMTPDKDQSAWDWFLDKLRNAPTPENDPGAQVGGQKIREAPPFGSKSPLNQPSGLGNDKDFIAQIKRERYEIGGSDGLAKLRRIEKLRSLLNSRGYPSGEVRDLSGITEYLRDFVEPDVKDWVHTKIPVYQYDEAGHQAMEQYYDRYGTMPDENNPEQAEEFMRLYKYFKRQ